MEQPCSAPEGSLQVTSAMEVAEAAEPEAATAREGEARSGHCATSPTAASRFADASMTAGLSGLVLPASPTGEEAAEQL